MTTASPLTLKEFGTYLLQDGAEFKVSDLKSIPFSAVFPSSKAPARLHVSTSKEFSELLTLCLGLSYLDKKKDALKSLCAEGLSEKEFALRLAELEATWPAQSVVRKSDGRPELDQTETPPLPKVLISATKIGALIGRGELASLLSGVDLADKEHLKAISAALPSRATHLVKLSVDSGSSRSDVKGGFFKVTPVSLPPTLAGSVTEQDYLTSNTRALTCNAGYQTKDWLAFTQVQYGGTQGCAVDLLARDPVLCSEVQAALAATPGATGVAELFDTLTSLQGAGFSGEPQLFCGEAADTKVVAPLMPLALPLELIRAKYSLKGMRDAELAQEVEAAAAEVALKDEALTQLKAVGAKVYPAGKTAYTEDLGKCKKALADAKVAAAKAGKGFLTIPTFPLMLGGSSPQNIGSGLTSAIHTSPVFTRIRDRAQRAVVGNKVFHPDSLLCVPTLRLEKLPACLADGADNAAARNSRKALFSQWALASLSPLLELREAWEQGSQPAAGALHDEAVTKFELLVEAKDPRMLFVKGAPGVTGNVAVETFKPITNKVVSQLKEAVRRTFKDAPINHLDDELRSAVESLVLRERT